MTPLIQALRKQPITPFESGLNAQGSLLTQSLIQSLIHDLETQQRAFIQVEFQLQQTLEENENLKAAVKALQDHTEQITTELEQKNQALSLASSQLVKGAEVLNQVAEPSPPTPQVLRHRRTLPPRKI